MHRYTFFLTSKHRALCSSVPVIPSLCSFSPYLMSYAGHSPHYLPQCKQPRLHASEYLTHINIFFIRRVVGEGKRGADKWDRRSSKAHKFPSLKQQRDYNNILSHTLILLLEYALFRGMKYSQWIFWIGENEYQHVQVALQAKLHIQAQMCKCKQEKCISRAPHTTSFRTEKKKANKNNNNSVMPLEFTISSRNHRHIQ